MRSLKEIYVGFVDQMAVKANSNSSRLWGFNKPIKRVATYLKSKVTGFYTINGHDVLDFPENNKKENFMKFLEKIREKKPVWKNSSDTRQFPNTSRYCSPRKSKKTEYTPTIPPTLFT